MQSISVVGCGFVGLSLAVVAASKGVKVFAVDIDKEKIENLKKTEPPFYEPKFDQMLKDFISQITFTTEYEQAIKNSQITFVTVGTPSNSDGSANLEFVKSAIKDIGSYLREKKEYHLVVIKSTVLPTITNTIIKPILENESSKETGKDFGLVMNPEFLREGSVIMDTENPHIIVIGSNEKKSADMLQSFYETLYKEKIPEIIKTTPENAELIKYANNSFLATKISFINTFANLCQKIPGTDVGVIAKAIGLDPRISPLFLMAGPGYGGSCFPKDVSALINFSKQLGYVPKLIVATHEVNQLQAEKIIEMIKLQMGKLKGKNISVLGLAFKGNTDDIRESVSINLINLLLKENAIVFAHDPMAIINAKKIFEKKVNFCEGIDKCLTNSNCCVIMTDWEQYKKIDMRLIELMSDQIIIDARRVLENRKFDSKVKLVILGTSSS